MDGINVLLLIAMYAVLEASQKSKQRELQNAETGGSNTIGKHVIAGSCGGVVARTVTAPIDRIKVLRQVTGNQIGFIIERTLREGGPMAFWKGNLLSVAKVAPESALKFSVYEEVKQIICRTQNKTQLTIGDRFVAASMTGVFVQTLIYPVDTLKVRVIMSDNDRYFGHVAKTISMIYSNHGLCGFYRGYMANLLGGIPYYGIELSCYETLKKLYGKRFGDKLTPQMAFSCAITSTCIAQLIVYPTNLLRTKAQAKGRQESVVQAVENIRATYGTRGLYHGIGPSLVRGIPTIGINYMVYESVRQKLGANMT